MKIYNLDEGLKQKIIQIEKEAIRVCERIKIKYQSILQKEAINMDIRFECSNLDLFSKIEYQEGDCFKRHYISQIRIDLECKYYLSDEGEVYDIWNCKSNMFRKKYGILYVEDLSQIERNIERLIDSYISKKREGD